MSKSHIRMDPLQIGNIYIYENPEETVIVKYSGKKFIDEYNLYKYIFNKIDPDFEDEKPVEIYNLSLIFNYEEFVFQKKTIPFFSLPLSSLFFDNFCKENVCKKNKKIKELCNQIQSGSGFAFKNDVSDFYNLFEANSPIFTPTEDCFLYRFVSPNYKFNYHPEKYKVGDIIDIDRPISTSIEPEFPVYIWAGDRQLSLLKIRFQKGKKYKLICLQDINKEALLKQIFYMANNQESLYQSEVTVGSGSFQVVGLKTLLVPSKKTLRDYYLDSYPFLREVEYIDEVPSKMHMIEVDYFSSLNTF
jgi:hypothetical protein